MLNRGRVCIWDCVEKFGGQIPVPLLKHHFNVSNSYVIKKLQIVLFPWRRSWERTKRPDAQGVEQWLPPRDDINSPDLYIPGAFIFSLSRETRRTNTCECGL